MKFQPIYYGERMISVNPCGDVGVVTLWSKTDVVRDFIERAGVDLNSETSRIAVIANLYGNGLPHMLRNLLHNPQIKHLVVLGIRMNESWIWLTNFFVGGLYETRSLGAKAYAIHETDHIIDGLVNREDFMSAPKVTVLGQHLDDVLTRTVSEYFAALPDQEECTCDRIEPPPIPEPEITRFPSNPISHQIIEDTPMQAWLRLIERIYRFGYRGDVAKKGGNEERIELLNTRVVIMDPWREDPQTVHKYGFNPEHFKKYQEDILNPKLPEGLAYSYGWRLRGYFIHEHTSDVVDSLEIVGKRLKEEPNSRHCYISLWDNSRDLPYGTRCPCFVSAFFRLFDEKLNLTALFRTHNVMTAWPENVYGLMAVLAYVSEIARLSPGSITVISHSASIDPNALERAKQLVDTLKTSDVVDAETGKIELRLDPNGEFTVTVDHEAKEIVVVHLYGGQQIATYRGRSAEIVEAKLAKAQALSVISHALYLGREIAKAEMELKQAKS